MATNAKKLKKRRGYFEKTMSLRTRVRVLKTGEEDSSCGGGVGMGSGEGGGDGGVER